MHVLVVFLLVLAAPWSEEAIRVFLLMKVLLIHVTQMSVGDCQIQMPPNPWSPHIGNLTLTLTEFLHRKSGG